MKRAMLSLLPLLPLLPPVVAAQTPSPRPALVVFITVDQMRADYLDRFGAQLTGGLARLKSGGAVFVNGFQDHGVTETAPGHATVLSGRFPRSTGIASNLFGVLDPQAPMLGGGGPPASPFRFRGSTLIDWMRVSDPRSRALSVSRKDRGAILPLGRAHQSAYWYAPDGRFTTSTYYGDTLPTWVTQFNARRLARQYAGRQWMLLLPESAYPEPDSVPVENGGRDFTFPHVAPADSAAAARVLGNYPWMDQLTLDFALEGVQQLSLGKGPAPDLLAISLSTTDAIGHAYGPDSREVHDQILRLDRMLGSFFERLFQLRDSASVIVALTADHGVTSFPEVYQAKTGRPAGHVDLSPAANTVAAMLRARGADSSAWVWEDGLLWVNRAAISRAGVSPDFAVREFMTAARADPGVWRVDEVRTLAQQDTVKDPVARRWYHMIPPDLPIEVVVTLKPHYVWENLPIAMHGQPTDDDAHVPIVFYGAPFKQGTYREAARVVDIAPTLAAVLGVVPTERVDGRVLRAAVRSGGSN
jgi:predicted AlkP superfamily pyrophosphatase or phosphodiesterase